MMICGSSMADNVKIQGIDELKRNLARLSAAAQGKAGRFAARKAAEVLAGAIRREVATVDDPATREDIAANVASRFNSRAARRGRLAYRVGIRGGAVSREKNQSEPGGDTFYWRFLNFGTRNMPAKLSIERAAQASESEVFQAFRVHFGRAIRRALKRAQKTASKR